MLHELAQPPGFGRRLRALLHPGFGASVLPGRLANFNPKAVTKVDYRNPKRPPLLLVTGAEDRICPPSVNQANFTKQRQAPAATEHQEYPGRCHFPGQDGWEEVADYVLNWTTEHANQGSAEPGVELAAHAHRRADSSDPGRRLAPAVRDRGHGSAAG